MTNSKQSALACKVVQQYQNGGEKVYELVAAEASLEVRVSSRALGGGARIWHLDAQLGGASSSQSISDEAETKRGALGKVAEQWTAQAAELGLPMVDWNAVEAALLAVRGV